MLIWLSLGRPISPIFTTSQQAANHLESGHQRFYLLCTSISQIALCSDGGQGQAMGHTSNSLLLATWHHCFLALSPNRNPWSRPRTGREGCARALCTYSAVAPLSWHIWSSTVPCASAQPSHSLSHPAWLCILAKSVELYTVKYLSPYISPIFFLQSIPQSTLPTRRSNSVTCEEPPRTVLWDALGTPPCPVHWRACLSAYASLQRELWPARWNFT